MKVGGSVCRPSLDESFPPPRHVIAPREFQSLGYGVSLATVLKMQMPRQLVTTVGHGSYTCLGASSSQTQRGIARRGCTSNASMTGTKRVSTVGALQCLLSFTVSFVRRVVGTQHPPQ
jgi:hypothetical protein